MKKILLSLLISITLLLRAMDAPPTAMHVKYNNTLVHLETIQRLYEGTHFQELLEYTRRFIQHPELDSFVDVIIKRLKESKEEAVVKRAWERKGKSLLEIAQNMRKKMAVNTIGTIGSLEQSALRPDMEELHSYANILYERAILHDRLLRSFHEKMVTKNPEFRFYPDSAP